MLSNQYKILWNRFLYEYYYSNHIDAKKWDIENDIFSSVMLGKKRIIIDYNAILDFDNKNNTDLAKIIDENMKDNIKELEEELNFEEDVEMDDPSKEYKFSLKKWNYPEPRDETDPNQFPKVRLKLGFKNLPNITPLIDTGKEKIWGKMIMVKGIIQNIGIPYSYIKQKKFECENCNFSIVETFSIIQKKINFERNRRCKFCNKVTKFLGKGEKIERVQIITISEKTSIGMPYTLKCVLPDDLVDDAEAEERKLLSGSEIILVGIIEGFNLPNHLVKIPILNVLYWQLENEDLKITEEDIEKIKRWSKKKNLIESMVQSFCPSVFGYEKVKEALILSCVGGVHKYNKIDKKLKRGSIHILLIGDPSTGKSSLTMFIYKYLKKAQFTVCSELSHAGLGVALVKDPETESWMISSGVLPLAHKSVAILDELDKANPDDIKSLNVVMELQMLPFSKGGIHAKLDAQTTVIGIANPKLSRFDEFLELKDQVKFDEVLLSRFDLKFAFKDIANEENDSKICDRITESEKVKTPMTSEFLFKYIAFCKNLEPKLSEESFEFLKKYYINLRKKTIDKSGILQITFRQFDALIRLTEAYAKLRLAKETNIEDSKNAIRLFEFYLNSFGFNPETGEIDIDRAEGRVSKQKRGKYYRMLEIMKELSKQFDGKVNEIDFFHACSREFTSADVEDWLKKAKNEGIIMEIKPKTYQIV